eukprot:762864-Hanusia_phi.AAC.3
MSPQGASERIQGKMGSARATRVTTRMRMVQRRARACWGEKSLPWNLWTWWSLTRYSSSILRYSDAARISLSTLGSFLTRSNPMANPWVKATLSATESRVPCGT